MASKQPPGEEPSSRNAVLKHWSLFGRKGTQQSHRVKATDWRTKPFSAPVTSAWNTHISQEALTKLVQGFKPQEMEDKWFVYADGQAADDVVRVRFFRSWTGFEIAEIRIVTARTRRGREAIVEKIVWESDNERIAGQTESGAKRIVSEVCRWVIGVEFGDDAASEGWSLCRLPDLRLFLLEHISRRRDRARGRTAAVPPPPQ